MKTVQLRILVLKIHKSEITHHFLIISIRFGLKYQTKNFITQHILSGDSGYKYNLNRTESSLKPIKII